MEFPVVLALELGEVQPEVTPSLEVTPPAVPLELVGVLLENTGMVVVVIGVVVVDVGIGCIIPVGAD